MDLQLVTQLRDGQVTTVASAPKTTALIEQADLIVFPMGSFYSSVYCNLLPTGIGTAIANAGCPKVYVPSMGTDPEVIGTPVSDLLSRLIGIIRQDAGPDTPIEDMVNVVLIDSQSGRYDPPIDTEALTRQGVQVADVPMTGPEGRIEPEPLVELLLSMT